MLAKWVTYQHARDTGDSSTESTYRRDLQKIVENTQAPWALRDLAMDALVIVGDFEGRDEWYVSLLEDETLLKIQENGNTGLSTLIQLSPRKKWKAKMIELTKSSNITVRSTAAKNLIDRLEGGDTEILKALIPWLDNPGWVKASKRGERMTLIKAFGDFLLPEVVPSLIAIVTNEPKFRYAAAMALGKYKDARAIPVLRNALAAEETHVGRNIFIGAIIDSGGLSDDEQMAALEAFASLAASPEERKKFETFVSTYRGRIGEIVLDDEEYEEEEISGDEAESEPKVPAPPLQVSIGAFVAGIEEPGEGLVTRAAERLKALWRTNPAVAAELAAIMLKWKGPAMYAETLRRIRTDEGSIDDILNALTNRQEISEKVPGALAEMRGAGGVSRAIGACIAEDHLTVLSILAGNETDSQIAMLGCTRMLRAGLPVNEVGEILGSSNKLLALAAERYLESDDSLEARNLILAGKKNEAAILGARTAFIPDPTRVRNSEALVKFFESSSQGQTVNTQLERLFKNKESELQKELLEAPDMIAVYAMLPGQDPGRTVVRIYKNKATFTFYEDAARYWEKPLTAEDCKALRDMLIEKKVDSLKPIRTCNGGCQPNEFIMFGRDGGRRVFFLAGQPPAPLDAIDNAFKAFRQADDIKLRYRLADTTPGLEVLWTDPKLPARAVWSGNGEVRLLTEDLDKGAENSASFLREVEALRKSTEGSDESAFRSRIEEMQRRAVEAKEAHFAWRKLENGRPADLVPQPPETPYLYDHTQAPEMPYIRSTPRGWQVRADASEIRAGEYYEPGLYRPAGQRNPLNSRKAFTRNRSFHATGGGSLP